MAEIRAKFFAGLSIANGYHSTAAGKALKQSWPAVERIKAAALGFDARYDLVEPVSAIHTRVTRRSRYNQAFGFDTRAAMSMDFVAEIVGGKPLA